MTSFKIMSITNLAGSICHRSAIHWSEDNNISLATEKGIHILVPVFRSHETSAVNFHRYFIPSPVERNQFNVNIVRDSFHDKLPRDLFYLLMLDRTLSPEVASQQSYHVYRSALWSPKFSTLNNRCCLATLTMDHRLQLHIPLGHSFENRSDDLSYILQEYVKANDYSECKYPLIPAGKHTSAELLYYKMKQRIYTLAAVDMLWTDMFHGDPNNFPFSQTQKSKWLQNSEFSLLMVAMKSGHIAIWEVSFSSPQKISTKILGLYHTNIHIIDSLSWVQINHISGLLAVGGHSGRIEIFFVKLTWNEGELSLTFKELSHIWEDEDKLAVSEMCFKKISHNIYHLVAGKGSYLIGFELFFSAENLSVKSKAITVGSHLTSLTGIIALPNSFLITSHDSCLQIVKIVSSEEGIEITSQKVILETVTANKSLMGISKSPTGILICSVGRLSGYFDHLAIKEPIDVAVFSLHSLSEAISLLLKHPRPLSNVRDILIYIQSLIGSGENFPEEFNKLVSLPMDKMQSQPTYILQIIRWLLKSRLANSEDSSIWEDKLQFIDNELIKQRLYMSISSLDTNRIKETSIEMKMIVNFISEVLQAFFKLETSELLMIQHVIASPAYVLNDARLMQENCPICNDIIPLDNLKIAKCPNGHSFGRCCLTTRACFLPTYRKCSTCDALALSTDWLVASSCTFCDGELR